MRLIEKSLAMITGMTAIIAQLVWARYVTQLLGLSSWTIASVIGMSLLGLALGNLWGGRKPRGQSPLRLASVLLCATGLSVLALPGVFWVLASLDVTFSESTFVAGGIGKLWILAAASPALLVHFFAGAVFPVLLKERESTASTAGSLAAAETLGGCIGAGLAGCLLMQWWGMQLTMLFSGTAAVVAGGLVWRLSHATVGEQNIHKPETIDASVFTLSLRIGVAIFMAGIASLGLEVVWQRVLILLLGTDAYSLTIVVVAYLVGIAAGAALAALWLKCDVKSSGGSWTTRVAVLQLSGALVSVFVLAAMVYLASGPGQAWLNDSPGMLQTPLLKRAALSCVLLLFPAAVFGASWPLLLRALESQSPDAELGKSELSALAAKVYSIVAFGNVAGVVLTGFFLVPVFGLQVSLVILISLTAVAVWMLVGASINRTVLALTIALGCLAVAKLIWWQPIGIVTTSEDVLLYYREGPANTVAVLAEHDRPTHRRLSVDGIVVGQSGDNVEEKQLLLAHLAPMLSAGRQPTKDAVVIGLGSGILSRELAGIDGVASVTSVELSPSVVEAAEQFADLCEPATATMATVQADGVWWLKQQARKFDAIVSDGKSRPGHVGNSAFFSRDYYRGAAGRLADEGVFVQWVSLDADVREIRIVVKTFARSFPHAYVAIATPNSIYLVGGNQPIHCEQKRVQAYLNAADAESLNGYHWRNVDDIRSMGWMKMEPASIDDDNGLLSHVEINSLDRPLLEGVSFDTRGEKLKANRIENLEMLQTLLPQVKSVGLFNEPAEQQADLKSAIVELLKMARHEVLQNEGWANKAIGHYRTASKTLPGLSRGQYLAKISFAAAVEAAEQNQPNKEADLLIQGASILGDDFTAQMRVAKRLDALSRYEDSIRIYSSAVQCMPNDVAANRGLAEALLKTEKRKLAARYFRAAGDQSRAAEIMQEFASPSLKTKFPKVPELKTDQQRTQRLLDMLDQ